MCQRVSFIACVFVAASTTSALVKLPFTDKPCGREDMEHRCARLACRKRHVIFDLDVIGQHGSICTGKTGGMLADSSRCFWQAGCSVQFPRERMLMGLFTDDIAAGSCVYKRPDALKVTKMKCVKEKEIYDMCSGKRLKKQGIIRSHEHYPWVNHRNDTEDIKCSLQYKLRKSKLLYITVMRLDHVTCDNLTINGEFVQEGTTYTYDSSVVTIAFTKCSQLQAAGSGLGFMLCFKEMKAGKGNISNVCEEISRKSEKKSNILEAGPRTKKCVQSLSRKKGKKARAIAKWQMTVDTWCCCHDNNCDDETELANQFKDEITSVFQWKTCASQDFPCECEPI